VGSYVQAYTLYSSVRPFGVSTIVAGVDGTGPQLFVVEPSGVFYVRRRAYGRACAAADALRRATTARRSARAARSRRQSSRSSRSRTSARARPCSRPRGCAPLSLCLSVRGALTRARAQHPPRARGLEGEGL
jgi:hypothetical protein